MFEDFTREKESIWSDEPKAPVVLFAVGVTLVIIVFLWSFNVPGDNVGFALFIALPAVLLSVLCFLAGLLFAVARLASGRKGKVGFALNTLGLLTYVLLFLIGIYW